MAIGNGSKYQAYVHSDYEHLLERMSHNPLAGSFTTKDTAKKESSELIQILTKIRNGLYSEAQRFVGDSSILENKSALQTIFAGSEKQIDLFSTVKEILISAEAQDVLTINSTIDLNEVSDLLTGEIKKDFNAMVSQKKVTVETEKEVLRMLHSIFSKRIIDVNTGKGSKMRQAKSFEKSFNDEGIQKAFAKDIKGTLRSKDSKVLVEKMKEQIISRSRADSQKQIKLGDFVRSRLKEKNLELYNNNMELVETLVVRLNSLKQLHTKQASGSITEDAIAIAINTMNSTNPVAKIQITVVGSQSEEYVQKNYIGQAIDAAAGVFKGQQKQSYSDWIVERNGVKVRVQVKNYRDSIRDYIGDIENNPNAQSLIHLGQEMHFADFLSKVQGTSNRIEGQDFFQDNELPYVLANQIWQSEAGSLRKGQSKGVRKTFSDVLLETQLTSFFLNYLGIVIDSTTHLVNQKQSNIFYYILGEGFVPTYQIIEDLINYFIKAEQQMTGLRLKTEIGSFDKNATAFYDKKRDAVGTFSTIGSWYKDSNLVSVGQEKGEEILRSVWIEGVDLVVQVAQLYSSAYIF